MYSTLFCHVKVWVSVLHFSGFFIGWLSKIPEVSFKFGFQNISVSEHQNFKVVVPTPHNTPYIMGGRDILRFASSVSKILRRQDLINRFFTGHVYIQSYQNWHVEGLKCAKEKMRAQCNCMPICPAPWQGQATSLAHHILGWIWGFIFISFHQ